MTLNTHQATDKSQQFLVDDHTIYTPRDVTNGQGPHRLILEWGPHHELLLTVLAKKA
jgi:hypothetical protein